jgi:MFS family permease
MGFGLIIPSQPFLAEHFGAKPATVTLLGTIYALMQFICAPIWGSASDKLGRRPILLTTIFLTMLGHSLFASATSLAVLFTARGLAGVGAANISTAQAVLADTNASNERSRAMAIIGVAFGLGFVVGPALGGLLFLFDTRAPAALGALLAAFNFLLVYAALPETRQPDLSSPKRRIKYRDLLHMDSKLFPLVTSTLLFVIAFSLMEQSIGLFIESQWVAADQAMRMHRATKLTSGFLVVVGISAIITQGYFVRKWLKKHSERSLILWGLSLVIISLLLIPVLGYIGSYPLFLLAGVGLAFGSGMYNPSMAGLVSLQSADDRQGQSLAMNQSAAALGRIIGPTISGTLFTWNHNLPYGVGVFLLLGASFTVFLTRPLPAISQE